MPKLLNTTDIDAQKTISNFGFSAKKIGALGATEYTLVTITLDKSTSTGPFRNELKQALQTVFDASKKHPYADKILIRVVFFNDNIVEQHGFVGLNDIDPTQYVINSTGSTALFDAVLSSIEATEKYGTDLSNMDYLVNGVIFIITDGEENSSVTGNEAKIKAALAKVQKDEKLESLKTILIGIGSSPSYLDNFKNNAGLDQFVSISQADAKNIAKMAQFVSASISSSSQALGTGGASQNLVI